MVAWRSTRHLTGESSETDFIQVSKRDRVTVHSSYMALNRANDVSAADWRSQTHGKKYCNFSRVGIQSLLVVEIPIKHPSLCDKVCFLLHVGMVYTGYGYSNQLKPLTQTHELVVNQCLCRKDMLA